MRKTDTVIFTKNIAECLSIALIQAKAGPSSSGTPLLVNIFLNQKLVISIHSFIWNYYYCKIHLTYFTKM